VVEVKWTGHPVGHFVLEGLRKRAASDPVLGPLERTCAVVSRSGFVGKAPQSDRKYLLTPADLLDVGKV